VHLLGSTGAIDCNLRSQMEENQPKYCRFGGYRCSRRSGRTFEGEQDGSINHDISFDDFLVAIGFGRILLAASCDRSPLE